MAKHAQSKSPARGNQRAPIVNPAAADRWLIYGNTKIKEFLLDFKLPLPKDDSKHTRRRLREMPQYIRVKRGYSAQLHFLTYKGEWITYSNSPSGYVSLVGLSATPAETSAWFKIRNDFKVRGISS